MDGGCNVTIVSRAHGDLRALIDLKSRTGDGPVVSEHSQLTLLNEFADRRYLEIKHIAVPKLHQAWARHIDEAAGISREYVARVHGPR